MMEKYAVSLNSQIEGLEYELSSIKDSLDKEAEHAPTQELAKMVNTETAIIAKLAILRRERDEQEGSSTSIDEETS